MEECLYHVAQAKRGDFRIFRKTAHIQNVGKQGLSLPVLKNTLHTIDDVWERGNLPSDDDVWDSFSKGDREREEFWLKRCLVDDENIHEFKIILLHIGPSTPDDPCPWHDIALLNTKTNKYYFRGMVSVRCLFTTQKYLTSKNCPKAKNKRFSIDYSNMGSVFEFWVRLREIVSRL